MKDWLNKYLKERPLFLSLIRAKEATLWQKCLPFESPVVDIGIGDGFFAKTVFGQIDIGLDLPESRIDEARKANVYKRLLEFDGKKIPLKNDFAGTVVSNCVLEHVEELPELLKDIRRILKPGGFFITTVMAKPWEDNLAGAMLMGNTYKNWMRSKQVHVNLLTYKEWKESFTKAGFSVKESIGYITPEACKWLDVCHYLSLPSLVSCKLTGKWTTIPNFFPTEELVKIFEKNCEADKSGAIFWVLTK